MCTAVEKCLVWHQMNSTSTITGRPMALCLRLTLQQKKRCFKYMGGQPHWLPVNPLKAQQTQTRQSLVKATSLSLDRVPRPWPYRHLGQLILQCGGPGPSPVGCLEISMSPCKEAPCGSVSDFKELSHKLSAKARPRGSSQGKQRQPSGWPTVEGCQLTFPQ